MNEIPKIAWAADITPEGNLIISCYQDERSLGHPDSQTLACLYDATRLYRKKVNLRVSQKSQKGSSGIGV
jgi:hypothetical protein